MQRPWKPLRRFVPVLALLSAACGSGGSTPAGTVAVDGQGADAGSDAGLGDATGGTQDVAIVDGKADGTSSDAATADGTGPGADASPDVPIDPENAKKAEAAKKAAATLHTAICKAEAKCGGLGLTYATLQGCETSLALYGFDFWNEGVELVAAGKASFHADKVAACVALADDKCMFWKQFDAGKVPAACAAVFTGLTADAGACQLDGECKSGYCHHDPKKDEACAGVCTAPAAKDAACTADAGCQGALVCTASDKCGEFQPVAKGQDCSFWPCAAGLTCQTKTDAVVCDTPLALGAACYVGEAACGPGLSCRGGDDQGVGKCQALLKAGDKCDVTAYEDGDDEQPCPQDHDCITPDVDKPALASCLPLADIGKACVGSLQCKAWDSWCAIEEGEDAGVCEALPGLDDACDPLTPEDIEAGAVACALPYVCDPASSKCVQPPGPGKDCIEWTCTVDAWCDVDGDGKCHAPGKLGEACVSDEEGGDTCAVGLLCGKATSKCVAPACP